MVLRRSILLAVLLVCGSAFVGNAEEPVPLSKPAIGDRYLDLMISYACYGKTIWQDDETGFGGSWGEGVRDRDGNGGVRATCSILYSHALLITAWDNGWFSPEQKAKLESCSLKPGEMLGLIEKNIEYLAAYHQSSPTETEKKWGRSWQSSLWSGAMGNGALLIWPKLSEAAKDRVRSIAFDEADQVASREPHSGSPGDTKAEELGWDTHALALALALEPEHENAGKWWQSLKRFAANTFSIRSDHESDEPIGEDIVKDIVTTVNIRDDYTIWNHGFFHPDYVQVSAQELGEAWLLLAQGDRLHGTDLAEKFHPYAMHNVEEIWEKVMRNIVLPWGELAFPAYNDWTFHTGLCNGYLAWIATQLNDPVAMLAERRNIEAAERRQANSPNGQILADSNMQWFWEPLLVKRLSSAFLFHALLGEPEITEDTAVELDQMNVTEFYPDSWLWLHRNENYLASVSWQNPRKGHFIPFDPEAENPYFSLSLFDGILPDDLLRVNQIGRSGGAEVIVLGGRSGKQCALICLPNSTVWISPNGFRYFGLENDRISGGTRLLSCATGEIEIPALKPMPQFDVPSNWLNVDNSLAMVTESGLFRYYPAGKHNRLSAAIDKIQPIGGARVWQMLPRCSVEETRAVAETFQADISEETAVIRVQDGPDGKRYRIRMDLKNIISSDLDPGRVQASTDTQPEHPIRHMLDQNPSTFTVFNCPTDVSPELCQESFTIPYDGDFGGVLNIQPRPNYGPLEMTVKALYENEEIGSWHFDVTGEPISIKLPRGDTLELAMKGCRHQRIPNMQILDMQILKKGISPAQNSPEELKDVVVEECD